MNTGRTFSTKFWYIICTLYVIEDVLYCYIPLQFALHYSLTKQQKNFAGCIFCVFHKTASHSCCTIQDVIYENYSPQKFLHCMV